MNKFGLFHYLVISLVIVSSLIPIASAIDAFHGLDQQSETNDYLSSEEDNLTPIYKPIWDGDHSKPDPFLVYEFHKKIVESSLKAQGKSTQEIQYAISSLQPPPGWRGMPTKGMVRIPVFLVDFSDAPHDPNQTTNDVGLKMFEDGNIDDYPYESLKNYYKRSSYKQLNIAGDVYGWYRAAHPRSYYQSLATTNGHEILINEILLAYDNQVNFTDYDADQNGKIDALFIKWAGSDTGWATFWWASTSLMNFPVTVDGVQPGNYVWSWYSNTNQGDPDKYYHPSTDIHETGHLLGLPDYYDYYDNIGPKGGVGGWDMMDWNWGDHNAFSKYLLGWIDPIVISNGDQIIDLHPSGTSSTGNAVLIMPGANINHYDEFFLVQYREPGLGNDPIGQDPNYPRSLWIWHIDATLDGTGQNFLYDNSLTSHKLLRLMEGDSREQIEKGGSYFDYFDFYYPGRFFGSKTVPNSQSYQGYRTNVAIYDLKQLPSVMQAHFSLNDVPPEQLSLGEALDSPVQLWLTDNSNHMWNWSGQNETFTHGNSAAQSGPISNNEWTRLTTIVEGPGDLSFYWKVSSELNYDKLHVVIDGVEQANISGDQDWIKKDFSGLSDGVHTIAWYYTKNAIIDLGEDAGWVDKFEWVPTISQVIIAGFNGTPTSGTVPLPVLFTDLSSNNPTGWAWYFGDENFTGSWTQMTPNTWCTARY